jgi:flagellar protein FliO/FliZ
MIDPDMQSLSWMRIILAVAVVAALLALMGAVLKYVKIRGFALPGGAAKDRRLQLVESLPLDARRRLVLVRCDQREHLLLLGGNEDIVITAPSSKPPAGLQTKSKA